MELLRQALLALMCGTLLCGLASPGQAQTEYLLGPDSQVQAGVPQGQTFDFDLAASAKYFPGSTSKVWVYVPAQYSPGKPACLCLGLDGPNYLPQTVFDNLIFKKQMPITIGVFLSSGTVNKAGTNQPLRFDRTYQFDSTNDNFARFLAEEVLPAVEARKTADGRAIRLSSDPNDRMIYGGSSGGVGAFTAAWQRPDLFRRVFSAIGTFVGMRGADEYPTLVRKTEPKPIRIFLQDGAQDTWNPLFGNWWTQNQSMEESLRFAGYDVNHSWGTLGHEGSHAQSLFPDAVKWLWRDYPKPIEAGSSSNSFLLTLLKPNQSWQPIEGRYQSPGELAADPRGEVFFQDTASHTILKIAEDGQAQPFATSVPRLNALSSGHDGRLYGAADDGRILVYDAGGKAQVLASGLRARSIFMASDNSIYATQMSAGGNAAGKIWLIRPNGARSVLDGGVRGADGILMTPDHSLLFVAQQGTHWIYSYVVQNNSLVHKQRFYWLHTGESTEDGAGGSGTAGMAIDKQGYLYVATRMGVQICDRVGRVEGILTLPQGQVSGLCFGGAQFDTLYAACAGRIYKRAMATPGAPNWAEPMPLPPFGAA